LACAGLKARQMRQACSGRPNRHSAITAHGCGWLKMPPFSLVPGANSTARISLQGTGLLEHRIEGGANDRRVRRIHGTGTNILFADGRVLIALAAGVNSNPQWDTAAPSEPLWLPYINKSSAYLP
jgi:prepilin-type processing-associated H-X9-DG protein